MCSSDLLYWHFEDIASYRYALVASLALPKLCNFAATGPDPFARCAHSGPQINQTARLAVGLLFRLGRISRSCLIRSRVGAVPIPGLSRAYPSMEWRMLSITIDAPKRLAVRWSNMGPSRSTRYRPPARSRIVLNRPSPPPEARPKGFRQIPLDCFWMLDLR